MAAQADERFDSIEAELRDLPQKIIQAVRNQLPKITKGDWIQPACMNRLIKLTHRTSKVGESNYLHSVSRADFFGNFAGSSAVSAAT